MMTAGSTEGLAHLQQLAKQQGLFERQPLYYGLLIGATLASYAVGLGVLPALERPALVVADAVLMGVVFAHVALLVHDLGHEQVFHDRRTNWAFGLVAANLLIGASLGWWVGKHRPHHANPNDADEDPDVRIPLLAFSEVQARQKRGLARAFARYQGLLFLPLLPFEAIHVRLRSFAVMAAGGAVYARLEPLFVALHYSLFPTAVLVAQGPSQGLLFLAVQNVVAGLYLGAVFAPNHIGMPLVVRGDALHAVRRQVETSRNVAGPALFDVLFAGLNHQIEHHLFPRMPRNQLRRASELVRPFCVAHGIPYHERGLLESYGEVLRHLHRCGAPLRGTRGPG